jgi:hypothetical protein
MVRSTSEKVEKLKVEKLNKRYEEIEKSCNDANCTGESPSCTCLYPNCPRYIRAKKLWAKEKKKG